MGEGVVVDSIARWWQLKYFLFSPLIIFGEDFQFDEHIFQMGWFNHQRDRYPTTTGPWKFLHQQNLTLRCTEVWDWTEAERTLRVGGCLGCLVGWFGMFGWFIIMQIPRKSRRPLK